MTDKTFFEPKREKKTILLKKDKNLFIISL